jgi:hypothetical protein
MLRVARLVPVPSGYGVKDTGNDTVKALRLRA